MDSSISNADFINRDFGVTEESAADLDGGYRSMGVNLIDRRYLTDHFQIVLEAGFEYFSRDIQDSPIAREDYRAEVSFSLLYHF